MNYDDAIMIVNEIQKKVHGLQITGSLKRKEPFVNDFDFITLEPIDKILNQFDKHFNFEIIKKGVRYLSLELDFMTIDIWKVDNKYQLFYKHLLRDIDKGHSIYLKKIAKNNGYLLNENGLFKNNEMVNIQTKKEFYKLLNIKPLKY